MIYQNVDLDELNANPYLEFEYIWNIFSNKRINVHVAKSIFLKFINLRLLYMQNVQKITPIKNLKTD